MIRRRKNKIAEFPLRPKRIRKCRGHRTTTHPIWWFSFRKYCKPRRTTVTDTRVVVGNEGEKYRFSTFISAGRRRDCKSIWQPLKATVDEADFRKAAPRNSYFDSSTFVRVFGRKDFLLFLCPPPNIHKEPTLGESPFSLSLYLVIVFVQSFTREVISPCHGP